MMLKINSYAHCCRNRCKTTKK